jgi:hypothetical protein
MLGIFLPVNKALARFSALQLEERNTKVIFKRLIRALDYAINKHAFFALILESIACQPVFLQYLHT